MSVATAIYIILLLGRLKYAASRAFAALIQLAVRDAGNVVGDVKPGSKLKVSPGIPKAQARNPKERDVAPGCANSEMRPPVPLFPAIE
jgi:hypothetical protein